MNCSATPSRADVPVAVGDARRARTGRRRSSGACPRAPGSGRSRSGCRSRRRRPRARPRSQRSKAACASSIVPVASIVARAGQLSPGAAVQVGSALERGVELDDRAADLPAPRAGRGSRRRSRRRRASPSIRFGSALQITVAGADRGAVLERRRPRRARSRRPDAAGEHGAGLGGGVGDRERAHPHAALDVAPDRALAVEVALVVHELDRGGAGVVRARPRCR